ncbi:MAG: hypothetical protein A2086_16035 [Spirochaetes bacterium GWD1_27_9]|nr:MAG: hypothetical protein A2Y34_11060 [Spirochaetes bacterium GWC1_27_15]OHD36225.1 MAG: hypothetical protein A2086_16035 [Spirochaetes bacterium GWD1_27_9]
MLLYKFLNYFFFVFHTSLIFFNLFGFLFKKTRLLNLITLSLTAFSWFILGIFYGIGYCFCTDWHWQVRAKLGIIDNFDSYIQFLVFKISGISFDINLTTVVAMIVFGIAFLFSILLNLSDFINYLKRTKKKN